MGIKNLVKQVLTKKENKKYLGLLRDRSVSYGTWLREQESRWSREREKADCEAVILLCPDKGRLASHAINNICDYFKQNPNVQVVYGDEDVQGADGEYSSPWFKPDWSPDLLDSYLYFGNIAAVRKSHWEELKEQYEYSYPGQWQKLFGDSKDGSCFWIADGERYAEWLHHCVKDGYKKGRGCVGHIPQILYHCGSEEEQTRFLRENRYLKKRREEERQEFQGECKMADGFPLVSVVIPSKDQPELLRQCLESVRISGEGIDLEVIVVDNGSTAQNKTKIENMIRETAEEVRYLYRPMEFNFSRMCNLGAEEAKGKRLLFLNDDVVLRQGCIQELAALAGRDYTGAVGIKLRYPDSVRIQHAGITNLPMGPVHKLQTMSDDTDYYGMANRGRRNFLAVTAACLMVEKKKFQEAGGFSEELRVAFNDVDFCFRLYELGYHNVCLNDIYAYHHESLSRGDDESEEKLSRLLGERKKLYERHPKLEGYDPYYSECLNREGLDVRIVPAYLTAGNKIQSVVSAQKIKDLSRYREDKCLMVRAEDVREGKITGWSIVLGDDNACYEKILLLREANAEGVAVTYGILLEGQYRPDLAENMPDQKNVALSGFWLEIARGALPHGTYRIGMAAKNRVTGLGLLNWSNRKAEL